MFQLLKVLLVCSNVIHDIFYLNRNILLSSEAKRMYMYHFFVFLSWFGFFYFKISDQRHRPFRASWYNSIFVTEKTLDRLSKSFSIQFRSPYMSLIFPSILYPSCNIVTSKLYFSMWISLLASPHLISHTRNEEHGIR